MTGMKRWALAAGMMALAAVGPGCGGGGDTAPSESASSRTSEGWALFEAGDFEGAAEKFGRAIVLDPTYAAAYSGLGWSYARLDTLGGAIDNFGRAIDASKTVWVLADSYAGSAPVYRDLHAAAAHFDSAVVYASNALSLDRRYVFEHDTRFDWHDLHLVMAQGYFALNVYAAANASVDSLGGIVQDPDSPTFVEDLAAEIERLETIYGN